MILHEEARRKEGETDPLGLGLDRLRKRRQILWQQTS